MLRFTQFMRYAATANTRSTTDLELVNNCRHDRLRAALYGSAPAPAVRQVSYEVVTSPEPTSSTTKAYFLVVGMSMVSLLGLVVVGAAAI